MTPGEEYIIRLKGTDIYGCVSIDDKIVKSGNILNPPSLNRSEICGGGNVQLQIDGALPNVVVLRVSLVLSNVEVVGISIDSQFTFNYT